MALGVLQFEKKKEHFIVRRAATFMIYKLFIGCGKEMVDVLGPEQVNAIYRMLKDMMDHDRDDITRAHAAAAFSQLKSNMKELLGLSSR